MDIKVRNDESICEVNESIRLIQKKNGIKFGTDSYLLSAFLKKNLPCRAADLGSGSGIVSLLAAARCNFKEIHAIEIQKDFADLAERNAVLNGFENRIISRYADIRDIGSLFDAGTFGAVFSNPPYMKTGCGAAPARDEMNTARREENGTIDDFCRAASYLLKFGGTFWTVYRPDRAAELIYSLKKHYLEPKRIVTVYPDIESSPCLILTESKKGASESVKMSRPLIIYDSPDNKKERKYTENMERVYRDFSLDFLFKK